MPNPNLSDHLDKRDKPNDPAHQFYSIKASRSEKILPDKSVELETSANTFQHSGKTDENLNKSTDSELLLHMQLKVDQLEERVQTLQQELKACEERLKAVTVQCDQEKARALLFQQEAEKAKAAVVESARAGEAER